MRTEFKFTATRGCAGKIFLSWMAFGVIYLIIVSAIWATCIIINHKWNSSFPQLIPGLGKLLETTPHKSVRNNIVFILCDMVVCYSGAVDPVVSQVSSLMKTLLISESFIYLKDPCPLVHKHTLMLLIHLLQEDHRSKDCLRWWQAAHNTATVAQAEQHYWPAVHRVHFSLERLQFKCLEYIKNRKSNVIVICCC